MTQAHQYQLKACKDSPRPLLNAACKEDPAGLGVNYDATNLDIWTKCQHTNRDLTKLPNFVQGDVCNMTMFEDKHFGTVCLGEFIEHCKVPAAERALKECHRVLKDDGLLVLTFPLDHRPPEKQHAARHLVTYLTGDSGSDITVAHQTIWSQEMLEDLFKVTGFTEISRTELIYGFITNKPNGWGIQLEKIL